jgi:copper chaperone CopZ
MFFSSGKERWLIRRFFMRVLGKGVFMDETNTEVAKPEPHSPEANAEFLETKIIGIAGMTCDKCVETIERAFRGKRGVKNVKVNRADATATVIYDERQTNLPELHDVLLKSGYKPVGGIAP